MGLDWHARVETTKEEQEAWVRKNFTRAIKTLADSASLLDLVPTTLDFYKDAPKYKKPCEVVDAPRMKERATFKEDMEESLREIKKTNKHEFWQERTVEEEMKRCAEYFDCSNCQFLKSLLGADATNNPFLGITVIPCDFRGKVISRGTGISESSKAEAYEEHTPEELHFYADSLEEEIRGIEELRLSELDFDEPDEEYMEALNMSIENLKGAIHWVRTCAEYGISMKTSY